MVEGWQAFQGGAIGASALEVFVIVAEVVRVEAGRAGVEVADVHSVNREAARAELEGEVAHHALERGLRGAEYAVAGQITNRIDPGNHQHAPAIAHHAARFLDRGDETVDAKRKRPRQI